MREGTELRIGVVSPSPVPIEAWLASLAVSQTLTNRDAKTATGESIWQGSEQMLQPQGHGAWKPDWHLSIAVLNLLHCLLTGSAGFTVRWEWKETAWFIYAIRDDEEYSRIPLAGNEELSYKPQRIRAGTKQKFVVGLTLAVLGEGHGAFEDQSSTNQWMLP